jgi:hypothetical protein
VSTDSEQVVFLETTVQIERLFWGTPERRGQIQSHIAGKRCATSSYVFMEFNRTVLQDLLFVRSLIEQQAAELNPLECLRDILRRLATSPPNVSGRSLRRCLLILDWFLGQAGLEGLNRDQLLAAVDLRVTYLRAQFFRIPSVNGGWVDIRENGCYSNATDCDLVKEGVNSANRVSQRLSCRREEARCCLVQFLQADPNPQKLEAIREAFRSAKPEHRDNEALEALERVMETPAAALGERTCWRLGDCIIGLEALPIGPVYTTDRHLLQVICPAIGGRTCP